jgi:hypothetical protein
MGEDGLDPQESRPASVSATGHPTRSMTHAELSHFNVESILVLGVGIHDGPSEHLIQEDEEQADHQVARKENDGPQKNPDQAGNRVEADGQITRQNKGESSCRKRQRAVRIRRTVHIAVMVDHVCGIDRKQDKDDDANHFENPISSRIRSHPAQ